MVEKVILENLKFFKRIDDLLFLESLLDQAYIIMVVPHRNMAYAWMKKGFKLKDAEKRLISTTILKNGIHCLAFKLTLD